MALIVNNSRLENFGAAEKHVQVPFEVDDNLLAHVNAVVKGELTYELTAEPKYKIMRILKEAGVPCPEIPIIDPILSNNWRNLAFMVLIDTIQPVDWKSYLRHLSLRNEHFTAFIGQVTRSDVFVGETPTKVRFLRWMLECKFDRVFTEVNDETRAIMKILRDMVNKNIKLFLLDPHSHVDYFTFEATPHTTWTCDAIRKPKRYQVGENTLATLDEFKARFKAFTYGILDGLDMNTCSFAGGSIAKMIQADFDWKYLGNSDIDLFVAGHDYDSRKANVQKIVDHITAKVNEINNLKDGVPTKHKVYFAVVGSLITIYIGGIERKFQLISNDKSNPGAVIHQFDVTSVQWVFDGERVYALPGAFHSLKYQISEFNLIHKLQINRIVKQIVNGYDVVYNADILQIVDVTDLLKQDTKKESDLAKILRDLRKGFYPKAIDIEDEDADSDNIALIEADQAIKGTIVTSDVEKVFNTVVIGGNFERTYDSAMFDQFNMATVKANKYTRYNRTELVKDTLRTVKLFTDVTTVVAINRIEGIEITLEISETFKKFCDSLNDSLWPRYTDKNLGQRVGTDNKVIINFSAIDIAIMHDRRRSPIRTINGRNLDITEDLQVGDKVQLIFSILVDIRKDGHVALKPITIIKHEVQPLGDTTPMTNMPVPEEEVEYDE